MITLPPELLLNIFSNLKISDLINCRMVCVRFRLLIDLFRFENLILKKRKNRMIRNLLIKLLMIRCTKSRNEARINKLSSIRLFPLDLNRLQSIKLRNSFIIRQSDFDALTKFPKLCQLSVKSIGCLSKEPIRLNLPKLTILEIFELKYLGSKLIIEAPKLIKFSVILDDKRSQIEFKYPESINDLTIGFGYSLSNCYPSTLESFKNVECFTFFKLNRKVNFLNEGARYQLDQDGNMMDNSILNQFSHLRMLNLAPSSFVEKIFYGPERLKNQELNDFMNKIIDRRTKLKRWNLRIFYKDVELLGNRRFEDYGLC